MNRKTDSKRKHHGLVGRIIALVLAALMLGSALFGVLYYIL